MTVQPPAERPAPGYYPDPSIPGFVRYWDGDAWTPGSARPAPEDGAPLPPPPRAARGGVRVAPPPPPRPAPVEETGPVFLDETGAAQLVVPPAAPDVPELRELPEAPRGPSLPPTRPTVRAEPVVQESSGTSVWGASAEAQPGLLDTGAVPRTVSWGVPAAPPPPPAAPAPRPSPPAAPEPAAEADPDDELASALRLALSQTRRAQLPPPTRYASESWSSDPDDGSDRDRQTAPEPAPRWTPDGVSVTRSPEDESPAASPADGVAATSAPTRETEPTRLAAGGGRFPDGARRREEHGSAVAAPMAHTGTTAVDSDGPALPVRTASARTAAARAEQSARVDAGTQGGRPAPRAAQQTAAAPGAGRAASGVRQKRAKSPRPALLGPRIGARLVDTVVTYALVGVLAVVLVQRVTLHLQAKIDAAQASGVPQTVWLVDGNVLASAGLLLAALLAVGIVYETIPLAVWGRTLGKAIFGLTVLDARSRARPKLARAFLRTAMCQTLVFLVLGIFELVPCATDRKLRQSWHDRIGRTFVVKQGG